jgi:hypothetical protein
VAGSVPRRARQLIPAGLPHRRQVIAACAVFIFLAHLLLAQLTLAVALACAVITRLSGWRRQWLILPAATGLVLTLAVGPGRAAAGYAAWPAHVLGYLDHGHLIVRLSHPLGAFAWTGNWLQAQLPIALIAGTAEAAMIGWLHWLRTDKRAGPPRAGAIAAVRGAMAAHAIRAGAVVTRDGCALGIAAGTGAIAELRWPQTAGGVLVTGASTQEVTVTSLQVVHAALRRRKPLVVIDAGAGAAIAGVLAAACAATGTPLRLAGIDLGRVIGERTAGLVAAASPEHVVRACGDLTALAAHLRQIGVDGDGLVWITGDERLPAQPLGALIQAAGEAGLAVLISTASPAAAAELAGLAAVLLIHRIADNALAGSLATRVSSAVANGAPGAMPATDPVPAPAVVMSPPATVSPAVIMSPPATVSPPVTAWMLRSLGPSEFVLAVSSPAERVAKFGRLVPARLPREAGRTAGSGRRL